MSGNHSRSGRPAWQAWPAICGLWFLYGLAHLLVALGKDGLALKGWTLRQMARLRGLS